MAQPMIFSVSSSTSAGVVVMLRLQAHEAGQRLFREFSHIESPDVGSICTSSLAPDSE